MVLSPYHTHTQNFWLKGYSGCETRKRLNPRSRCSHSKTFPQHPTQISFSLYLCLYLYLSLSFCLSVSFSLCLSLPSLSVCYKRCKLNTIRWKKNSEQNMGKESGTFILSPGMPLPPTGHCELHSSFLSIPGGKGQSLAWTHLSALSPNPIPNLPTWLNYKRGSLPADGDRKLP